MIRAMFALACAIALAACSDDHSHEHSSGGHTSPYPSCNEITQTCHSVDVGDGPIHDCHDKAHGAKDDATCAAIKDNCLSICRAAADGGTGGDGGS